MFLQAVDEGVVYVLGSGYLCTVLRRKYPGDAGHRDYQLIINIQKDKTKMMKRETWKTILQIAISVLTAALTALGTASCKGFFS
jgi:hypothetical protein